MSFRSSGVESADENINVGDVGNFKLQQARSKAGKRSSWVGTSTFEVTFPDSDSEISSMTLPRTPSLPVQFPNLGGHL